MSSALLMVVTRNSALCPGAGSVVHRAAETFLENRPIDFAEFRGGGGILDADNNPVRMEKIRDGGAFAKKFRIGDDAEFHFAVLGVGGKGAAEFKAGARGTVLFSMTSLDDFASAAICRATLSMAERSASPESFGGVPHR